MFYTIIGSTVLSPYIGTVMAILFVFRKYKHFAWDELGNHTFTKGLLLLAVWSTISGYVDEHWISVAASVVLWLYLGVVLYMQSERKSLSDFAKYGNWVLLCGVVSAVIGFLQYIGWIGRGESAINYVFGFATLAPDPENRITSTFGNANLAGAWFSVLTLMATYYFYQSKNALRKNGYLVLILVFFGSLMLTGSRGAIAGLLCGLFVYLFFRFKHLRLGLFALFGTAFVTFLVHPTLLPRVDLLHESMIDRLTIWKICFQLFLHHPIEGVGLANTYFVDSVETSYYRIAHAHNTILAMFVELGLVGGLIFLWMHWSLAKYVYFLHKVNHRAVPLILGLFTFFFVHGMVDYTLMAPQIGIIYIILSGFVVRTWKEENVERKRIESLRREWLLEKTRRAAKASGAV